MGKLLNYAIRRFLLIPPIIIAVSLLLFFTLHAAGDPIKIMLAEHPGITPETIDLLRGFYGLDKPLWEQYFLWLYRYAQLNFGMSIYGGVSVNFLVLNGMLESLKLIFVSLAIAAAMGISLGVYAAAHPYSKIDSIISAGSLFGLAVPTFWLGIIMIMLFSFYMPLFPSFGAHSGNVQGFVNVLMDDLYHLVLPTFVLSVTYMPQYMRLVRASTMEVLRQDYISSARSCGIPERTILYKHALKNSLAPVLTYTGIYVGQAVAGAPLTETVFSWPGLGFFFIRAIRGLDIPVVMAVTIIMAIMILISTFITDIAYAAIDPRIRIE